MGFTRVIYVLVAFPVLAVSPETTTETVVVATETVVVATETVTVTAPEQTVTVYVDPTPPLPTPTVSHMCDTKHGVG
jgi:hypothetical protein